MRAYKMLTGQALVEFALIFPLLFLLVMGLFDLGRAVFYYSTLNTAVREGTRFAIVQPDCDYRLDPSTCSGGYLETYPLNCESAISTANTKICADIKEIFFTSELSNSTITINHPGSSTDDPLISIGIDYLFKPITPGIALLGNLTIHVDSQMLMTAIAKP